MAIRAGPAHAIVSRAPEIFAQCLLAEAPRVDQVSRTNLELSNSSVTNDLEPKCRYRGGDPFSQGFRVVQMLLVDLCCSGRKWIHGNGDSKLFAKAAMVHRRFAFRSIANQLPRPRRHFLRTATHLKGFPTYIAKQGPTAVFLFLVVRADADSDRLVRRPIQFALALCRSIRHLVLRTRVYGVGE